MNKRVDLPEKKYEGYIFDLDGTLVDSMPLHYKAWRKALAAQELPHPSSGRMNSTPAAENPPMTWCTS